MGSTTAVFSGNTSAMEVCCVFTGVSGVFSRALSMGLVVFLAGLEAEIRGEVGCAARVDSQAIGVVV